MEENVKIRNAVTHLEHLRHNNNVTIGLMDAYLMV